MILRPYQQRLVDGVVEQLRTHKSTLLQAATGTGKTVMFCWLARRNLPARTLMLSHRTELLHQARVKMQKFGLQCEIEKAELYANTNPLFGTPVVLSSIQTQCSGPRGNRRYLRFKPTDFSFLIADECHHVLADSWMEVINYYSNGNPDLKILGVTATPERADEKGLRNVFESVAGTYDIEDAIEDGYLVDIHQQFVTVRGLDYSGIHTTAGDLNEGELAKVLEIERNIHGMCQPLLESIHALEPKTLSTVPPEDWKSYLCGQPNKPRRTIVFAVSVAQSERYCQVLSRAMRGVEWVCGATAKEDRKQIVSRFETGETHVVVNCGVFTEGFDNAAVELIGMARPTKSRVLFTQMCGRGTRPLPGVVDDPALDSPEKRRLAIRASPKPRCLILDFVGNSGKHDLVTCIDMLAGKMSEEARVLAKQEAKKSLRPVRIMRTITEAQAELEKRKREEAERRRLEEAERAKHLLVGSNYSKKDVSLFGKQTTKYGKINGNGFHKPPSEKQAKILRYHGCPNPMELTRKQAGHFMGMLAANKWRTPDKWPWRKKAA